MTSATIDLTSYDAILVNTSAGKDSQAMMDMIVKLAREAGCLDKVIAVHADLGRVEHQGTLELAREQAEFYGLPFEVVERTQGDLLDNILQKHASIVRRDKRDRSGKLQHPWPDTQNTWCTSEHKTAQVTKLMTALVDKISNRIWGRKFSKGSDMPRKVRILSCLGLRSQESGKRSKRLAEMVAENGVAARFETKASNGKRSVDEWFPIADWDLEQVWACIFESGAPWSPVYDGLTKGDRKGMSRLSCCFCIMASKRDLVISAKHNPALAQEYIKVENLTKSRFRMDMSISELVELAASPEADKIIGQEPTEESFDCAA